MIVAKLGGSLLPNVMAVRQALAQIQSQSAIGILVVSALQGQTRCLLELAQAPSHTLAQQLIATWQQHFTQAGVDMNTPVITQAFALITQAGQHQHALSTQQQDTLLAQGELLTSWLVYQLCQQLEWPAYWHDSRQSIRTTNQYGAADIINCQLSPQASGCMITQGFIGADAKGCTTTLGFEGSDYSASMIAATVKASALWLYKDVGALYSADPRWLPQAQAYPCLSYQQAMSMAQAGASVIHPQAVSPMQDAQLPIYITALDHQQQTRISQQAYDHWFTVIAHATDQLILLGDCSILNLQGGQIIQQSQHYISVRVPAQQRDTIAAHWHQQLKEQ